MTPPVCADTATSAANDILSVQLREDMSVAGETLLRPSGFRPMLCSGVMFGIAGQTSAKGLGFFLDQKAEAFWRGVEAYRPRTRLGKRLWEIRERILASNKRLLGWDDVEREIATRRGEREA